MVKTLIVESKLKELAVHEDKKLCVSSDAKDKLERITMQAIKRATERAVENGRTTVMPKDF